MALKYVALVLCGLACASAANWVTDASDCSSVEPSQGFGQGNATTDLKTTVAISTPVTGVPDSALCPGILYNFKITFPESRKYILAATQGNVTGAEPCMTSSGKASYGRRISAVGMGSLTVQLTLKCSASGTVGLQVASVKANATSTASYKKLSLQLPVAALSVCKASPCYTAAAATTATSTSVSATSLATQSTSTTAQFNLPDLASLFGGFALASSTENPLSALVSVVQTLANATKSNITSTNIDLVTGLTNMVNAVKTFGSVINPSSSTTSATSSTAASDLTGFLTAMQTFGSVLNPQAANSTGLLGLLNGLSTVGNLVKSSLSSLDSSGTSNQLTVMLDALKNIGNLFNPTSTLGASTNPMQNVISAGQDVVASLQSLIPVSGQPTLDLPSIVLFVQKIGAFFKTLATLVPVMSG